MRMPQLPRAHLDAAETSRPGKAGSGGDPLYILSDEALAGSCGVHLAFAGRSGGLSEPPYRGLNLATHVGDDPSVVQGNRAILLDALGASDLPLLAANQVHGDDLVLVEDDGPAALDQARRTAEAGADGFVVTTGGVAVLLCFADCVPVAVVSPTGAFALVHAGWRGVVASIAPKAAGVLASCEAEGPEAPFATAADALASYNVYLGPYIHGECFEVDGEAREQLVALGGSACAPDDRHVDLGCVLRAELVQAGVRSERIVESGICTACNVDAFYSYRAEGGTCGRFGAVAFRREDGHGNS